MEIYDDLMERFKKIDPDFDASKMAASARAASKLSFVTASKLLAHLKKCRVCQAACVVADEKVNAGVKHPIPEFCEEGRMFSMGIIHTLLEGAAELFEHFMSSGTQQQFEALLKKCPNCNELMLNVTNDKINKHCVCPKCRAFLVVTEDMKLRLLTADDIVNLDAEIRSALIRARDHLRKEAAA